MLRFQCLTRECQFSSILNEWEDITTSTGCCPCCGCKNWVIKDAITGEILT